MNKEFLIKESEKVFNKLKNLKVLIVGDLIIDEYVFALPKGRAVKDPILSTEFKDREYYAGGVLAVANHISGFVKEVKVITLVGDKIPYEKFSLKSLMKKNVLIKPFVKKDSYTTLKKRYISPYRFEKLFKMEYISDKPISKALSDKIINNIKKLSSESDLIIVTDFGHGFLNQAIRNCLLSRKKFLAVNVQSNSSNMGYNYFTPYKYANFLSLCEEEIRLPLNTRFESIETVMKYAYKKIGLKNFIVTLGKRGSIYCKEGGLHKCKVLTEDRVDTMGSGDALFSITSLLAYIKAKNKIIPFVGNAAGGLIANSIGNKESITPNKIIKFIKEIGG